MLNYDFVKIVIANMFGVTEYYHSKRSVNRIVNSVVNQSILACLIISNVEICSSHGNELRRVWFSFDDSQRHVYELIWKKKLLILFFYRLNLDRFLIERGFTVNCRLQSMIVSRLIIARRRFSGAIWMLWRRQESSTVLAGTDRRSSCLQQHPKTGPLTGQSVAVSQ